MRRFQLISKQLSKIHKTQFQNFKFPNFITPTLPESQNSITSQHFNFTTIAQESNPPLASDEVKALVDEISELTLLEISDLSEVLRNKLDIQMPVMAVMMPGMTFSGIGGGGAAAAAAAAAGAAVAGKVEEKVEKTVFDVKLDGFDAAAKIKVIKEVRGFTDLGLKEAKDLVEKAPTLLKKGVTKEEAEKIIAKMKEVGAKVSME